MNKNMIDALVKALGPLLKSKSEFIEVTWLGCAAVERGMQESGPHPTDTPFTPDPEDDLFAAPRLRMLSREGIHGLVDRVGLGSVVQYQGNNLIVEESYQEMAELIEPSEDTTAF